MSRVFGSALAGVDGASVEVEVRLSAQLPRVDIVGLPEAAVRESAARVRAAIAASGQRFPDQRVTVNLAPAGLRKSGAGLDLPIAVGILAAGGAFESPPPTLFVGELALDGRLRPVRGVLAMTLAAREAGCRHAVVALENGPEAALAPGVDVRVARDLGQVVAALAQVCALDRAEPTAAAEDTAAHPCLSEVRGQERAKRALEIAAAGGHGLLLRGPPGSGKSMLARRLPGLLPGLPFEEALEVTRIHSVAGLLPADRPLVASRPFRAPHHTASAAGLLGGGSPPRPGEASLAHRGVLFLDELPEFGRRALEGLREVLEERVVRLARARWHAVLPAAFQLVAASNPCPCGWYGSSVRDCRCDDAAVARYRTRVSGALLDRIDLVAPMPAVRWEALDAPPAGEPSTVVRERVARARERQRTRDGACNAEVADRALDGAARPSAEARALLARTVDRHGLSARRVRRTLRVARTIADLAGQPVVEGPAMAEALSFVGEAEPGR